MERFIGRFKCHDNRIVARVRDDAELQAAVGSAGEDSEERVGLEGEDVIARNRRRHKSAMAVREGNVAAPTADELRQMAPTARFIAAVRARRGSRA